MSTTMTAEICKSSKKDSFSKATCLEEKAHNLLFVILREKEISIPPGLPAYLISIQMQIRCE